MAAPDKPYRAAWNDYRRRRNCALILLFVYPVVPVLYNQHAIDNRTAGIVTAVWAALLCAALTWLKWWDCPRCGDRYAGWVWRTNVMRRSCSSCGLEKWSGD